MKPHTYRSAARIRLHAVAALLAWSTAGWASGSWPERPITWVVGGAAGGPTDAIARAVAQAVSEKLGQPIVIENVGGAGGTIATTKVAKSKADGYTFLIGHVGYIAAAPSLYRSLPYDPVKNLDAVMRLPDIPAVVVVHAKAPFNTLQEMLDYAKSNPGKLNFGDAGVGSMSNLATAMLASRAGVKIMAVSYKGNAPAMLDVAAGTIDGMIDPINTAAPQVRGGKVKALAVTSTAAVSQLPDVPTVAARFPGFESTIWFGLYGPRGTPAEAIEKTHKAYLEALGEPAVKARLTEQGALFLPQQSYAPASLKAFTAAEIGKYRDVIRDAGIAAQ